MNIIENVRGQPTRDAYKEGHQIENVVDLQDAIMVAWNNLQLSYIQNLFHSISPRLISVMQHKEVETTY